MHRQQEVSLVQLLRCSEELLQCGAELGPRQLLAERVMHDTSNKQPVACTAMQQELTT